MKKRIGLIFPHQLFQWEQHPLNNPKLNLDIIYLVEDSLFFADKYTRIHFHKSKIVLHRASMRAFWSTMIQSTEKKNGPKFEYIEYQSTKTIRDMVKQWGSDHTYLCVDPTDYLLEKRLRETCFDMVLLESPLFINTRADNQAWLKGKKTFLMENFYRWQRKRLDILMDGEEPMGGQWNFDHDNRKKIPKKEIPHIPQDPDPIHNEYIQEAQQYVDDNFDTHIGSYKKFWYPIDHAGATQWLDNFLVVRFEKFGMYEDAMTNRHHVLYHSCLSALINIGLLSPLSVVNKAITYAENNDIPLNSLEGFVRQIIGWREYMRMMYELQGVPMRTSNHWNHKRKISQHWYNATTGISPLDDVITKTMDTAYAHHIERLMVVGNYMFLCGIHPDEAYRWFMECYIDSYDWVMVPNVYAMSQNAADGIITTKPYISGSHYIRKMSHYPDGDWTEVWDALYWDFLIRNEEELKQNHRMHMIVSRVSKMTYETKQHYQQRAKTFRKSLGRS